ncbi:unnamed protein product [Larinioides sclopetarius]|uniref:Uncharacterized protein n=1 Tax=Larinioides sclopetarius TaxID=280406 RepID=A0AAV1Z190_9ARAC
MRESEVYFIIRNVREQIAEGSSCRADLMDAESYMFLSTDLLSNLQACFEIHLATSGAECQRWLAMDIIGKSLDRVRSSLFQDYVIVADVAPFDTERSYNPNLNNIEVWKIYTNIKTMVGYSKKE